MLNSIHPKLPMRDKAITRQYYIGQLGFRQLGPTDFEGYLMIHKDDIEIHFFEFKELDPNENYGQVYIRTNDIEELYQSLLNKKVVIHPAGRLETKPWGQKEFSLLDPDKNLLTFGQSVLTQPQDNKLHLFKNPMTILIRKAVEDDAERVWPLMQKLAVFEHYIDSFAITPEVVREKGFRKSPPDFYCILAEDPGSREIAGMLVYYFIPYTAQNRPAIYLKELYIEEPYRANGVGRQLMSALREEARANNCSQIKWSVAPWNDAGKRFYEKLGARENRDWLHYEWNV